LDTYHGHFGVHPLHPFPARMAPSIAFNHLRTARRRRLTVLDPMVGSGTTVIAARREGHVGIGFDTDPLAQLLAKVSVADVNAKLLSGRAVAVYERTCRDYRAISQAEAYPAGADEETKRFIRYWFDVSARRQLTALSRAIDAHGHGQKPMLWCAFSRLIVAKDVGASLARDLSHSRPHRAYKRSPIRPLQEFLAEVRFIAKNSVFTDVAKKRPPATVRASDARRLPLDGGSVDLVITSPPYLNAIDYIRCSKFTLVWLGHQIADLRKLRASNVGTEVSQRESERSEIVRRICDELDPQENLAPRDRAMLARYVDDMDTVIGEIARVLRGGGKAVTVIGDSTISGHFIRNSVALTRLFSRHGMRQARRVVRDLPPNRRYLPPPKQRNTDNRMHARMRQEVVLTFSKPS
jgi:hypothetical protein